MNIIIQNVSENIRIDTEVGPDYPVPNLGFLMGEVELEEEDTFEYNGVQEGSVIDVPSTTVILVLAYLIDKGYTLEKCLWVKFDYQHATDILNALIEMCESTQESDMKIFFEQLQRDNKEATEKMRNLQERAIDGALGVNYDEWSWQMSRLDTIGCDALYWKAEELFDEDNFEHLSYKLDNTLVSILTTIKDYVETRQ
jgi:hypothetical protein